MHLVPLIKDLAIILGVAAVVTFIFRRIKQPVVLGYIIAGIIVGPHTPEFFSVTDLPNIQIWAELGVIFLMFSLGLEFSFRKLVKVGASATVAAVTQIVLMIALGYGFGRAMAWSGMDSVFLGCMIAISSTTIIIKAFEELGLKTRRFAQMVFAILIVEDLAAIIILVALSGMAAGGAVSGLGLLMTALKLMFVVGIWFLVGMFVVPRFVHSVRRHGDGEMLTVVSVGLCLALVTVSAYFDYSVALGSFIMGAILAETSEAERIEHLVRPLRDIFGAIFFVSVGMLMDPHVILDHFGVLLGLAAIIIVGKVLSITLGSLVTGQTIGNSVRTGFSMAQIGEFSFIIATLGVSHKVISDSLYPIIVAASLITTFTTPYLVRFSSRLVEKLERVIPRPIQNIFEQYATLLQRRSKLVGQRPPALLTAGRFEQAKNLYRWSLAQFKSGFNLQNPRHDHEEMLDRLAPWDAHLVSVVVHPNSSLVAKRLIDLKLREEYGLNVVVIQRGSQNIVAPSGEEILLPNDQLLFLGTDDQLDALRVHIETPPADNAAPGLSDYQLKQIYIHENSPLNGHSIKESGIREQFHSMVVGIERGDEKIFNPKSDQQVCSGDIFWVVGSVGEIQKLLKFSKS